MHTSGLRVHGRAFAHIAAFHPEITALRRDLEPSMGAEDFSFMLQVKPGAYMRIGQGEKNGVGSCFLHNNRYDFNDDILPFGPALHASLVERATPIQSPSTI